MKKLIFYILFFKLFSSCMSEPRSPNFIFIYTDDQRFDTVSSLGSNEIYTPNLDKLARQGTAFSHTYNMGAWHGAICVASRAMIITGKSVWNAKDEIETLSKSDSSAISRTWPKLLSNNGYMTYMSGKWHVNAPIEKIFDIIKNVKPGMPDDNRAKLYENISKWKEESGKLIDFENYMPIGYARPKNEKDQTWNSYDSIFGGFWEGGKHWSEVLADDAIDFLEESKNHDAPHFMYLSFNAPHDPRQAPKKFLDLYPIEDISLPKNYATQHPYYKEIGNVPGLRDEALAPYPRSKFAVKKHIQEYYAAISHLDEQIGRIIKFMEQEEMLDNTYIIFTSDHGLSVGQHGLIGKQSLYDHSIRVPMIISGPGIKKNRVVNHDIYLQDVMPTTLDLAGITIPKNVDFKSLKPILFEEENEKLYNGIYGTFGCCSSSNYTDFQRMIRKDDFKLMLFPVNKRIELYNIKEDPNEIDDLATLPKYDEVIKSLFNDLIEIQKGVNDTLDLKKIFGI